MFRSKMKLIFRLWQCDTYFLKKALEPVAFFFLSWNCIAWISDDILPVYLSVFIRPLFFKVPCTLCSVLSRVFLFGTTWTIAGQALSMGFFRQEYWSGLPFPHPGYFPKPAIEPASPVSPALQMDLYCWATGEAWGYKNTYIKYNRVTNSSQEEFQ